MAKRKTRKRRRNAATGDTPPDREIRWPGWTSRTEAPEESGDDKVYGSWETGTARDGDDQWYEVDHAGGSDYAGGTYAESNYDVLTDMLEEHHPGGSTPAVWANTHGGHGTYGLLVVWDRLDESVQAAINSLSEDPVLDEQHLSMLESEKEGEAWVNWVQDEFETKLAAMFELDDFPESIDSSALFSSASDTVSEYWEHGAEGPYIDVDRVAKAAAQEIESDADLRHAFAAPAGNPRESNAALGHGRALTKKDKQVLAAFLDQRELESKKLYTDGKRLDGLWMGGTGIAKWNDAGTVFTFTDLGSRAAQQIQRAVDKAADKKWGSIQRNPCGRPHSKEPNMLRMTKSRVKFIAFLEDTLIPDLYESGTDATAETFEQLVAFLKGAGWSPEGQTREDFMYFLQYTLIPDMRESGSIYTANDLARGLRYLERDAGQRRNPSAKWLARAGGSDVNRYAELEEKLGEVHLYIREDTKRDARRTALEYEPGKVTYIEKIKDGLWNVWIKPEGGTPRQRNGIGRDGRAAIGAAIGGAVGGGYYGGLGGGLGAAAGSLVGAHMAELVGAVKGVGEGATKARRRELVSETKEDVKELKKETREAVREKRAANSDTGAAARRVTVRRRR